MRSKEESIRKQMSRVSNEDSGQHSETVYRDKFGKKIDMDVEKKKSEAIELAQKMNIENQKQFNRGVAQREMEQQRYLELMDQKNQSMTV
jgi:pre-mRNA-splicing factor CWC26